ncbi:TPA: Ref family recombination enhancement nuclease [Citrobacter werkmanii]
MAKHQTKAEKAHVNRVAELGCVACYVQAGVWGTPGQIHHIREGQGMAQRSGWFEVICLCLNHHTYSGNGKLAIHAGKELFTNAYGSERDLLILTNENL